MSFYKVNIYKKFTFSRNRYQFNINFKTFNKYQFKIFTEKVWLVKRE